jgi:hypothetical protein
MTGRRCSGRLLARLPAWLPFVGVRNARLRLAEVAADTDRVRTHVDAIHREYELNDWTRTAKRAFAGHRALGRD